MKRYESQTYRGNRLFFPERNVAAWAVIAADEHWACELHCSRPVIADRLNRLFGAGVVKCIEISSGAIRGHRHSRRTGGHRLASPAVNCATGRSVAVVYDQGSAHPLLFEESRKS